MFPRRLIVIAVVALAVIGLFVVPSIQRDAWTQGYLAGQLASQDGAKAAPLTPFLYPGYTGYGPAAFGPHFGFGGILFFGLLLFFLLGVGRHLHGGRCRQGWREHMEKHGWGPRDWHGDRPQEGPAEGADEPRTGGGQEPTSWRRGEGPREYYGSRGNV